MAIHKIIFGSFLALAAIPLTSLAAMPDMSNSGTIYTQISNNGLGIGYAKEINHEFSVRGQYNGSSTMSVSNLSTQSFGASATIKTDLSLSSLELLGDWYPTNNGFRVTTGVVFNNNKINVAGTGAKVGEAPNKTVNVEIKMSKSPSPYLGIGYSTRAADRAGFGFIVDLGVMAQDPSVSVTSTGVSQADINKATSEIQTELDKLKMFPVFAIGVSYSF
jgi:hypothetical protein